MKKLKINKLTTLKIEFLHGLERTRDPDKCSSGYLESRKLEFYCNSINLPGVA